MTEPNQKDKDKEHQLHLGYKIQNREVPVVADFKYLLNHSAVLAQSGAGKSTLLGRVVEEILTKTSARIMIIDANGDFRKTHIIAPEKDPKKEPYANIGLTPSEFAESLKQSEKIYLTRNREAPAAGEEVADAVTQSFEHPKQVEPMISWGQLDPEWQTEVLELELNEHPDEVSALDRIRTRLAQHTNPQSPLTMAEELDFLSKTNTDTNKLSKETIVRLSSRLKKANAVHLWVEQGTAPDLSSSVKSSARLLVLDVPSLANPKSEMIVVAHFLKAVWEHARAAWEQAQALKPGETDSRTPIFLVIDEAQNFVPAEDPSYPLALRSSRIIQRIAGEGRKYGLFLMIATQRPPKVRPGFLAECLNVCVMRLQSKDDRELVMDTWGLHSEDVSPIKNYNQKGQALLCGAWAGENPIAFKGGPRRTEATGGDLPKKWILKNISDNG